MQKHSSQNMMNSIMSPGSSTTQCNEPLNLWLDKLTHLHKATTEDPLYYFNIFFGLALLFMAVSSFFMFAKSSVIFKKGLWFTLGGIILVIIMLYV